MQSACLTFTQGKNSHWIYCENSLNNFIPELQCTLVRVRIEFIELRFIEEFYSRLDHWTFIGPSPDVKMGFWAVDGVTNFYFPETWVNVHKLRWQVYRHPNRTPPQAPTALNSLPIPAPQNSLPTPFEDIRQVTTIWRQIYCNFDVKTN